MPVKMRLRREGKKKQPFYRVVVADVRSPRDGRFIEDIGFYQPLHDPSTISIDRERALYWLRNGVQPSDAVVNLLRIEGIWEEFRPGDTGKRGRREKQEGGVSLRQARGRAGVQAEPEAKPAPPPPEVEAAREQAVEEDTQPAPGPAEETGALPEALPEAVAEEGAEEGAAQASAESAAGETAAPDTAGGDEGEGSEQ